MKAMISCVLLCAVLTAPPAPASAQTRCFQRGDSGWTLSTGGSSADDAAYNRGLLASYTHRGLIDVGLGWDNEEHPVSGSTDGDVWIAFATVTPLNPRTESGWGAQLGGRYDVIETAAWFWLSPEDVEFSRRRFLTTARVYGRRRLSPDFRVVAGLCGFYAFSKSHWRDEGGDTVYGKDVSRAGVALECEILAADHLYFAAGLMHRQEQDYRRGGEVWETGVSWRVGVVFGLQAGAEEAKHAG